MATFLRSLAGMALSWRTCAVLSASGLAGLAAATWGRAVLLMIAVALGGCATLPDHVERPASYARLDTAETSLAKIEAASTPAGPRDLSGFRLLPDAGQAFDARLALIRRAEKTIDAQYYVIASDGTGLQFLRELSDAAARGVRVRILVDDLYAGGQDELFVGLAAHENVEVRMFNPLPVRNGSVATRIALSLNQFSRINHRMHNKLLIADGTFAVTGGRNIADEYFDRSGHANFIDMDVLSAGPVVQALELVFDRFWNSDLAYPVQSLTGDGSATASVPAHAADALAPAPALPALSALGAELSSGRLELEAGTADVFADAPQKAEGDSEAATVARAHLTLLGLAESEVLIASPYFVPGSTAMQVLSDMRARDVRVSVLTNSYATTDEPLVHLGYARHRETLLRAGIELHELMPSGVAAGETTSSLGGSGLVPSLGRLHTKLTVIDGEKTFLGSMNMDARSALLNTEAGMVIHSAPLARAVAKFLRSREEDSSYALRLQGGRLSWLSGDGMSRSSRSTEPQPAASPALPVRVLAQLLGEDLL